MMNNMWVHEYGRPKKVIYNKYGSSLEDGRCQVE
jgi:hypothetical protein